MNNNYDSKAIHDILLLCLERKSLQKIVLSRPSNPLEKRSECRLFQNKGKSFIQIETFTSDNKAYHKNIDLSDAPDIITALIMSSYRQTNIFDNGGTCEILISKSKSIHIKNHIGDAPETEASEHNGEKKYILSGDEATAFLTKLGVCDENGQIFDKKRSKYKQINRFLEILDGLYSSLPESKLTVCDLCCGKSYLTFAVYFYLHSIKKRETVIYGIDLKSDVIEYCNNVAAGLGFDGLHFVCSDIRDFVPPENPGLVISLHACDTATDSVLAFAVAHDAKVILSTPCCHHELMHSELADCFDFISKQSILKQKLCDAVTDAMRVALLESRGYQSDAIELIDPDETPKNVMIRAIRKYDPDFARSRKALLRYQSASDLFGSDIALYKMLYD